MKHPEYLVPKLAGQMGRFKGGKWVKKDGEAFGCPEERLAEAAKLGYITSEKKVAPSNKPASEDTDTQKTAEGATTFNYSDFRAFVKKMGVGEAQDAIAFIQDTLKVKVEKEREALKAQLAALDEIEI